MAITGKLSDLRERLHQAGIAASERRPSVVIDRMIGSRDVRIGLPAQWLGLDAEESPYVYFTCDRSHWSHVERVGTNATTGNDIYRPVENSQLDDLEKELQDAAESGDPDDVIEVLSTYADSLTLKEYVDATERRLQRSKAPTRPFRVTGPSIDDNDIPF